MDTRSPDPSRRRRRRPGRRMPPPVQPGAAARRFAREALSAAAVIAAFVAPGLVVAALAPAGGGPAALLPPPLEAGPGATTRLSSGAWGLYHPGSDAGTAEPEGREPARAGSRRPAGSAPPRAYPPSMPPRRPARPDPLPASELPGAPEPAPLEPGAGLWVVDGYNVLQVAVLRGEERHAFWRREARERLVELARRLAASTGSGPGVRLVFDGPWPAGSGAGADAATPRSGSGRPPQAVEAGDAPTAGAAGSGTVEVVFAPSADAYLLALARSPAPRPGHAGTRADGGGCGWIAVTADRRLAARLRHRGVEVRTPAEFVAACRAGGSEPASLPAGEPRTA